MAPIQFGIYSVVVTNPNEKLQWKSRIRSVLVFFAHEWIATFGAMSLAPFLMDALLILPRILGRHTPSSYPGRSFSGSRYFLPQLLLALFLGWFFSRLFRHRSMLWVWVLPFVVLCFAIATVPTLPPQLLSPASGPPPSGWAYYFGPVCRPPNRCGNQLLHRLFVTMPFFLSIAYSASAFVGRKFREFSRPLTRWQFRSTLAVAFIFLFPLCEIGVGLTVIAFGNASYLNIFGEMEKSDAWGFLGIGIAISAILGSVAIYLPYLSFRMRRTLPPASTAGADSALIPQSPTG
jgi:hypothetical protein